MTWPTKISDRGGLRYHETPWGDAYGDPPPNREPLTVAQIADVPDGSAIGVLWSGGNGMCRYELRRWNGRPYAHIIGDDRLVWRSHDALLDTRQVGRERWQHKVWLLD